jgi:hypothetical protein
MTLAKSLEEMEDAADEAFASYGKRPMGRKENAERKRR